VAVIVSATPVLAPIMSSAGFDPLWFGVVLTAILGIGLLTPPFGANLGVVDSITSDVQPTNVFRSTIPFLVCTALAILLLVTFPGIALWLPNTLSGAGI
jgi:TRAP-type C4-dicarboxylate transport system permease large subunit